MKKLITYVTAAALMMGSMCTTAYGATFADIDTVTWSGFKPFLNEAAELGLMSGYDENGKKYCKPRNNVTYCEATQLMYSIMKVYSGQDVSNATVTKWKPVMSAYNIPDWAYKATAYSLDNGILSTTDLTKLQGNAQKINVKAATREDVGVIFGKALDTISGYDTKSNAGLSYKDKAKVSAAAVPYLELLNRVNLMVGDTDNNFNPKANISRAEMAVLSVKTYHKLTESGAAETTDKQMVAATVTSSRIMANGDLFLSLTLNAGGGLSLFAAEDEVVPRYNGDKITFADIAAGDTVKVTYEGTNITALEVIYSKNGIRQTTQETFELADITDKKVIVKDGSKEKDYRLSDDVDIELDGKSSTVKKLRAALEYANYDVTLTLDEDEYVLLLEATMNANNPTEGYVSDVESDKITIKAGTKEYTYPLADNVEIEYDGKTVKFSKFEKDYDEYNYKVSLELNGSNEADEIIIVSMEDEYSGTLTSITSKKISFTAGRDEYEYDLHDDVDVKVDGKSSSVSALRESFRDGVAYVVTVDTDRDDEVTEIIAESKYSGNNDGELKDIDTYEITVLVDDKNYSYDLASDVDVTLNGKSSDLDDLITYFGEYAFTVELKFDSNGEVKEIAAELAETKEGILRDIVDAEYITIRAADINIDLDLASSVDVTLDGEDVTLDALNDQIDYAYGDSRIYVELSYNSSGKVKAIDANWEDVIGELKTVDENKDEIKVGTKTYEMARNADFVYVLGASAEEEDYRSSYDNDLDGLGKFLDDCKDAYDTCMVSLTLNNSGDVTRVKAVAK